jgi:hypothetical protein
MSKKFETHTITEMWKHYRDSVYPEPLSAIQNQELHKAWFASAFQLIIYMQQIAELHEDAATGEMEKLWQEASAVVKAHADIHNKDNDK